MKGITMNKIMKSDLLNGVVEIDYTCVNIFKAFLEKKGLHYTIDQNLSRVIAVRLASQSKSINFELDIFDDDLLLLLNEFESLNS